MTNPIYAPPPHLLKKFSRQASESSAKRGAPNYLKTFATLCIEWAMNSQPTPNDRQIRSFDITPPPELVQQWMTEFYGTPIAPGEAITDIATRAAAWGSDQELEACCELLVKQGLGFVDDLRAARRPKPPSLKEQALAALQEAAHMADDIPPQGICSDQIDTIRRALEALDD